MGGGHSVRKRTVWRGEIITLLGKGKCMHLTHPQRSRRTFWSPEPQKHQGWGSLSLCPQVLQVWWLRVKE